MFVFGPQQRLLRAVRAAELEHKLRTLAVDAEGRLVMTFAFARIGAEVATLLTGPAWPGHLVIELGSMVSADQVAEQLGEVLKLDVKAFAVPRAGWAEAFEHDAPGVSNLGTWVRRHPRRRGGADAAGLARL